jgi:hypothetical protein
MKTLLPGNKEFRLQLRNIKTLVTLTLLFLLIALLAFGFFLYQQQQHRPPVNPIIRENQLPGTSAWKITRGTPIDDKTFRSPVIEGYAWTTSAIAGDTVSFSVSTNQPHFSADIYRLGWYQGKGGRLLQTIPSMQGHFYPMPSIDPQTGLVQANWPVSFSVKIARNWVTGMYVAKLIAANRVEAYAPFVVRSVRPTDFVFIHAATTDQAYNNWGGKSLYAYNSTESKRAYKVSFDRPFLDQAGFGNLLYWEYPMIRWLEMNGYDLGYLSTEDIQSDGALLKNHHGILVVGHSEYWSKEMRDNLESAINSGVNFAAFAGDTMSWQIRYEPSSSKNGTVPNRIIVCYKDKTLDPLYGKDNSQVTNDPNNPPINRPLQPLLGEMHAGYFYRTTTNYGYAWVVADASSWVFEDTGLTNGDSLPGLVGYEYDKVFANYPKPPGLDILASSPVYNVTTNTDVVSNATLYTARSGARVFNAGTIEWSWGLDSFNLADGHPDVVNQIAQKITENILQNFLTNVPNEKES